MVIPLCTFGGAITMADVVHKVKISFAMLVIEM